MNNISRITKSTASLFPIAPFNKESSFLVALNIIILINYGLLNLMSMLRYFVNQTTFIPILALFTFSLKILPLIISLIKIVYYRDNNSYFSLLALVILTFGSLFFVCKFAFNFTNMLISWPDLLTTIFLSVALYGTSFDSVCMIHILTIGLPFFVRVFCSITNIIPGVSSFTSSGVEYNDLGFGNHNAGMVIFLFIAFSYTYIFRNIKRKYCIAIITSVLTIFFYTFTHSKTSSCILLLLILILFYLSFIDSQEYKSKKSTMIVKIHKLANIILSFTPLVSFLLTLIGLFMYSFLISTSTNPRVLSILATNTFLDRFNQLYKDCALHNIPLPFSYYIPDSNLVTNFNYLFGSYSKTRFADNLYHRLFINYGLLVLFLFISILQYFTRYAYKKNHTILLILLSLISLFNISESHGIILSFNPFLFIPFTVLSESFVPSIVYQ